MCAPVITFRIPIKSVNRICCNNFIIIFSGVSGNKDLLAVMKATASIGNWSVLSLQFGITKAEYQKINRNVMMQGGDLEMEIISRWFQLGNASWSALVNYLCEVDEVDLAQEIAKAHPC